VQKDTRAGQNNRRVIHFVRDILSWTNILYLVSDKVGQKCFREVTKIFSDIVLSDGMAHAEVYVFT